MRVSAIGEMGTEIEGTEGSANICLKNVPRGYWIGLWNGPPRHTDRIRLDRE